MKCWVCVLNHGGGHHQVTLAGQGSEGQGSWGGRAAAETEVDGTLPQARCLGDCPGMQSGVISPGGREWVSLP